MKIAQVTSDKRPLDRPVVLTIETVEELHWVYAAFSGAIHMRGVEEDSPQQQVYTATATALNDICAEYRAQSYTATATALNDICAEYRAQSRPAPRNSASGAF
jgi:hypothetical protein